MKRLTIFLFFLLYYSDANSQNSTAFLNGFKYAVVTPLEYKNGVRDAYGIEYSTIQALQKIGITCLSSSSDGSTDWPSDALEEPCQVAYITIGEGRLPNEWNCGFVKLTIRNCKNQIFFDELLKSKNAICSYPYTCCYSKWASAISSFITEKGYKFDPTINKLRTEYPEVEKMSENEESIRTHLETISVNSIEGIYKSYQSSQMQNYKIGIIKSGGKYKAIILESENKIWKPGEVKAIFEPSSLNTLFSVKWYMSDKTPVETFASLDKGSILFVEFTDKSSGAKVKERFIKLFPVANASVSKKADAMAASGSGFFLSPDGVIATNAHVIEDASRIEIVMSGDSKSATYMAKVLLVDKKNDVALLQINDDRFKEMTSLPYGISENSTSGSRVFTIGYPLNDLLGTNCKVTDGIISSVTGIDDDVRFYQITVPLQPGNSGGPLFNKYGNVIGIATARLNPEAVGTQIQNVNYAIKSSYLINLYNMLPGGKNLTSSSKISSMDLEHQVEVLKNYVCLIRVF